MRQKALLPENGNHDLHNRQEGDEQLNSIPIDWRSQKDIFWPTKKKQKCVVYSLNVH